MLQNTNNNENSELIAKILTDHNKILQHLQLGTSIPILTEFKG